MTKTLAELQALCVRHGLVVPPQRRPAKGPYIRALRDLFWARENPDRPLPEQVEPMLLGDWHDLDEAEAALIEADHSGWCVQEKHDGVRVLVQVTDEGVRITGRAVSEVTFRLSEFQANLPHLTTGFDHLVGTILDGELVCPAAVVDTGDTVTTHPPQAAVAVLATSPESRRKKPRSAHTVRGYMNSVLAALNWAHLQGWLPTAPRVRKIKTPRQKVMKGRPITATEFQKLLDSAATVVGDEAAGSWMHVLRGLWASALRLDELMHVSWDKPGAIRPVWKAGRHPILEIPAALQKNDTEESIPLLPWFESVLKETPVEQRRGWVFNPASLQLKMGRKVRSQRPDAEWVGKVIARIGKEAGVEVEPADARTGRPAKYATAHDLRRSCGERLRDAGVPPLVICRVMRHSSWETTRKHYAPGNVQSDAEVLQSVLAAREKGVAEKPAG
jgi:integrase